MPKHKDIKASSVLRGVLKAMASKSEHVMNRPKTYDGQATADTGIVVGISMCLRELEDLKLVEMIEELEKHQAPRSKRRVQLEDE